MAMDMTFLLIASFPDSLIRFRGHLINDLLTKGFDVHVAVPYKDVDDSVFQALKDKGVNLNYIPLERTGINPLKDFKLLVSLYRLMLKIRPVHVLTYTVKPVIYGSFAAWSARVPNRFALITGLGYAFTNSNFSSKRKLLRTIIQYLYRFTIDKVDKVFFQNPDDEKLFRKLGILPGKIKSLVVNGSGVDVSEYSVTSLPFTPKFLLIARLLGDKGIREYVAAARIIKAKYPQSIFHLVGWIDDNPDAISQQELDSWTEAKLINYIGRLSDVRTAIADSSVYVFPSYYREGTPRTILEAMSMGRAIVTTDSPGCRETVIDGYNGFIVPVKNVSGLVTAVEAFITKPELIESMGARSRQIAEKKYDVHKVNAMMFKEMGI